MSKKLDTSKLAKIVEIKYTPEIGGTYIEGNKLLLDIVVEIEKITFIYDDGDIGGEFRVIESKNNKPPKNLVLALPRVTLENIEENEET